MPALRTRLFVRALFFSGVVATGVTSSCKPVTLKPSGGLVECPHTWTTMYQLGNNKPTVSYVVPLSGLPLSGAQTNVPEYNDCQRFVIGDRYGPLMAIFAAFQLDEVARELDRLSQQHDSVTMSPKNFLAVAQILNQGPETYAPLSLPPGFSCLRLYVRGMMLQAKVQYIGMNPPDCLNDFDPTKPSADLAVKARTLPGFVDKDYPPVARWEWDPDHGHQYISILCGLRRWCEVGPNNFSSARPRDPSANTDAEARVKRIKGWYDEQQMDVIVGGKLVPSAIHAAFIPAPDLKDLTINDYQDKWPRTGYISLDKDIPAYKVKLNITQVAPNSALKAMNTVDMCYGRHARCGIVQTALHFNNSTCTKEMWAADTASWWARIRSAQDLPNSTPTYRYFCVIRRTHPTGGVMGVPGTARWRWLDEDPTGWESCPDGCCEIQSKK